MSKRQESKYKINRRLGVNLWGRAKSPLNRREYGPGQHGQRRKKPTDYGTQLMAKQKLKGYYGNIGERQFRRLYDEAVRRRGDTGENLIELLERRLDAVVYRMKFVPTVFAARQFVNHGHVTVTDELAGRENGRHEFHAVDDGVEAAFQQLDHVLRRVALAARGFVVIAAELALTDIAVIALQLLLGHQLRAVVGRLLAALTVLAGAIFATIDRALCTAPQIDAKTAVDLMLRIQTLAQNIHLLVVFKLSR